MAQQKTPVVSKELVEYLSRIFPNRCPQMTDTDRQIWAAVGNQEVIRHLRKLHDTQAASAL